MLHSSTHLAHALIDKTILTAWQANAMGTVEVKDFPSPPACWIDPWFVLKGHGGRLTQCTRLDERNAPASYSQSQTAIYRIVISQHVCNMLY